MLKRRLHHLKVLNFHVNRNPNPRTRLLFSTAAPNVSEYTQRRVLGALLLTGGAAAVAGVATYLKRPIYNEASAFTEQTEQSSSGATLPAFSVSGVEDDGHLVTLAWGTKSSNLTGSSEKAIPISVPWLRDVALRDLALHKSHGACVDARGDVYQWNEKSSLANDTPMLTLQGKDIKSVQLTEENLIALSSSGAVFVAPSNPLALVSESSSSQGSYLSSHFSLSWLIGSSLPAHITQLSTTEKFTSGEKFVSISAGDEHMLALTSKGRTFSYPLSKNANLHGQLGYRKFDIASPTSSTTRIPTELIPKYIKDPYAKSSRFIRPPSLDQDTLEPANEAEDGSIYCDRLFEVPALRGILIDQAVAGARTSFVRTKGEGRVLAWGANEFGQLGLGSTLIVDTISIPTEVVLSRSAPSSSQTRCIDITTGGDLTYFTVERQDGSSAPTIDLLACGNGQWGSLGNGLYSNAQGKPVRVKTVSGLTEYSEKTESVQPIRPHAISASPTGHVLLTLDTLDRSGATNPTLSRATSSSSPSTPSSSSPLPSLQSQQTTAGRDLFVWGLNRDYELGNGRRGNLAVPVNLEGREGRVMLAKRLAVVRDMAGRKWKGGKGAEVEQTAVAGYGASVIYWRIC